jgi:hypothetical protein
VPTISAVLTHGHAEKLPGPHGNLCMLCIALLK